MKTLMTILGVAIIAALIYAGYMWSRNDRVDMAGQAVTVEGEYICLPHLDTDGPQTLECALGIRTDDGTNYALNTSDLDEGAMIDAATGDRIEVIGTVTPRESLTSGDRLLIYDIEGVIHASAVRSMEAPQNEHVLTGGVVSFAVPEDFGLAVTAEQVLVDSVVPPCAEGFDYCLYYNDPRFEQTNFESAGLRIDIRDDLVGEEACLTTLPAGYTNLTPGQNEADAYATSVFTPLQESGAGHTSEGSLYRLSFNDSCYEFETRIGTSQIDNFDPEAIDEFTADDRRFVESRIMDVLQTVRLVGNEDQPVF